jgi:hypothetical protein
VLFRSTVIGLDLAPGLRRHGSDVVAASILEATSTAVEQANARRAQLVSGSVGLAVTGRRQAAEIAAGQPSGAPSEAPAVGRGTG